MRTYTLSQDAAFDLYEIWDYIAEDNVEAADRWIAKLLDTFDAIARTPGIGHQRQDLTGFQVLFGRDSCGHSGSPRYSVLPETQTLKLK